MLQISKLVAGMSLNACKQAIRMIQRLTRDLTRFPYRQNLRMTEDKEASIESPACHFDMCHLYIVFANVILLILSSLGHIM